MGGNEMRLLLCIDDTDNYESIGTGQLLEEMCHAMEACGLATGGFVTRHQLFIHEDIEYTSHNSSMCCEVKTEDYDATLRFAREYLEKHAAEGSDPGLCLLKAGGRNRREAADFGPLMEFGIKAQNQVLQKADAYALAEQYQGLLNLSEHGGTGDGIIGALAGIGLRLSGADGRVKGKIFPQDGFEKLTVAEFCKKYKAEQIVDENGKRLGGEVLLTFARETKAVLQDNLVTILARKCEEGYEPIPHKKRR